MVALWATSRHFWKSNAFPIHLTHFFLTAHNISGLLT